MHAGGLTLHHSLKNGRLLRMLINISFYAISRVKRGTLNGIYRRILSANDVCASILIGRDACRWSDLASQPEERTRGTVARERRAVSHNVKWRSRQCVERTDFPSIRP
ncbi:MAG: hypothetical protein WC477_04130 [Patescibacteria group bacterium]